MELFFIPASDFQRIDLLSFRLSEDLIFARDAIRFLKIISHMTNIGDVLNELNLKTFHHCQSNYEICQEKCSQVSDMGISIYSRTTAVEPQRFSIRDL